MKSVFSKRPILGKVSACAAFAALTLLTCATISVGAPDVQNFTFYHVSDEHFPSPSGLKTISEMGSASGILLKPYNTTADKASFIIETGDQLEFGPTNGGWESLEAGYEKIGIPHYFTVGNHDSTWRSMTSVMRKAYGNVFYSFDKNGCHFVMLDTAGLQDPRPAITPEELEWLKADLEKAGPDTPVFVAFHHPLDSIEFSSVYETDRLMDVLRPYNVVELLVGHGHTARWQNYDGIDMVQGGSGSTPNPGFQIDCIKDGMLRIAYKKQGADIADKAILEKPLAPPAKRYPAISIESPKQRAVATGSVAIKAWVRLSKDEVTAAYAEVDGANRVEITPRPGGSFEGSFAPSSLLPGAHWMRISFVGPKGAIYHKSTYFYVNSNQPKVLWRTYLGAASKSTPAVGVDAVYVGTYDGLLRAYNRKTGAAKWTFKTGGAIVCEPLLMNGKVYFTSEDGNLYCVSAASGKQVWKFQADDAAYSSPISDGKAVYFGCGNGAFYSVDAVNGKQNWKNTEATYNIELKPAIADGKIFYGAWDRYEYCLNTADGALVWKCMGQGSAEGSAPAYYSPADCGPVVAGGKVFAPDRKWRMSVIDTVSGKLEKFVDGVSAAALSADGTALYVRKNADKALAKLNMDGTQVWSAAIEMDEAPVPPKELNGVVYATSKRGLLSAVSPQDGKILWQYQVTPSSYVFGSVSGDKSAIFIAGTDGSLTAIAQ